MYVAQEGLHVFTIQISLPPLLQGGVKQRFCPLPPHGPLKYMRRLASCLTHTSWDELLLYNLNMPSLKEQLCFQRLWCLILGDQLLPLFQKLLNLPGFFKRRLTGKNILVTVLNFRRHVSAKCIRVFSKP